MIGAQAAQADTGSELHIRLFLGRCYRNPVWAASWPTTAGACSNHCHTLCSLTPCPDAASRTWAVVNEPVARSASSRGPPSTHAFPGRHAPRRLLRSSPSTRPSGHPPAPNWPALTSQDTRRAALPLAHHTFGPRKWLVRHHARSACRAVSDNGRMDEDVIPILHVVDAAVAVRWYERLGFVKQWEHRFEPGFPAFVEVTRGKVRLFLSEHQGDARPGTLVSLHVRDVDAIAVEFGVAVEDLPWSRQIELRDPDENRLRVGTPTE